MVTYARRPPKEVAEDGVEEGAVEERPRSDRWSRLREVMVSGFIIIALIVAAVWSIPDSPIKRALNPSLLPVARATGLDQSWRMFSPDPPRAVSEIETYVQFDSGLRRVWTFDRDRDILGSFHYDRWRKLKEQLLNEAQLRPAFAMWVVRQLTQPGEKPLRVWMVRDTRTTPAPGADGPNKRERKLLYDRIFEKAS
ncbi:hypothetical protein [Mycolicibacterium arenosum]|uniref:Uncharacterized protein n=1 Tax=Mycolicibacterium arenosum TaxID=2952157 RepID=A0ABT1M2E4_9MYCO|nr:hypothetical protein [Mycolicibacterium sp. CAU 1645]MCP9272022.1 hypothetical protein [Mycolicibacterium sp. CAU 1645]